MKEKSPKKHSAQAIKDSYWDYQFVHFDPGSVEEADIAKQNFGAMARPYYVDIIYKCRRCKDEFTFEVKEQKVWYEEFGFHVDAHPVNCVDCRIKVRKEKKLYQKFSSFKKIMIKIYHLKRLNK